MLSNGSLARGGLRQWAPDDGESALVAQLRAGNDDAYETLVRTHGGPMLRTAWRLLGNEDDARDAVQESFLSAFRTMAGFKGESRLATWLHRIVVNHSLMKLRTRNRQPATSIEELLPKYLSDGHQVSPSSEWSLPADRAIERMEVRTLVRSSIDRLPDRYRIVLILRDIEELSTEEAARLLRVNNNTIKIRLHRARQALRSLLDPHLRSV